MVKGLDGIFSKHGDDALENESAGADAVFATGDQGVECVGDISCGLAGDLDPVVAEEGLEGAREQEVEGGVAGREVGDGHPVNRFVELGVEVVDPELVEVAEHDVGRTVGHEVEPVVERLLVVLGKLHAAGLHLDEAAARPDEVGELGALTLTFDPRPIRWARGTDAVFEG